MVDGINIRRADAGISEGGSWCAADYGYEQQETWSDLSWQGCKSASDCRSLTSAIDLDYTTGVLKACLASLAASAADIIVIYYILTDCPCL